MNKRILMLNYEFYPNKRGMQNCPPLGGGASPVSYELAKGYAKAGHTVDKINGEGVS